MSPTVSVLMPVYNASATLSDCIESVLSQTYADLELVCVDDGSTDGSARMIQEAGKRDRRVKLIRGGRRGIVGALNLGLTACSGKFIARMDADDIMHSERIREQLRYFSDGGRFDLIGARVRMISDSGVLSPGVMRYETWTNSLLSHEAMMQDLFVESPLVHPTFFLRKEYYEELGGYRDHPWAEDYDLILRAYLKNATFGKVPEPLLLWRDSGERLIRNDRRCQRSAMFRAKVHYFLRAGFLWRKGSVVIAGTGPSGREVARLFLDEGIRIKCFVDNLGGPENRTVMGIRAFGFAEKAPAEFFRKLGDSYCILCIGDDGGKRAFTRRLEEAGMVQGKDFVRFV
ncbi:MAG: glycosyltransferase [Deltaproteobacteria bacterium]|nr:glycosyltransferase [Deltaproteobacteria bacterium]